MRPTPLHIILCCFASIVIFLSCSKGGVGTDDSGPHVISPEDTTAAVISIFTPLNNQVFSSSNTISITGRVTDDLGLYRGTIRITNDANGALLVDQRYEIHGLKLYNFSINHVTSVSSVSNYTVTVSFEDHGSNLTTQSVNVKVNP